jgi:hypothetical protein
LTQKSLHKQEEETKITDGIASFIQLTQNFSNTQITPTFNKTMEWIENQKKKNKKDNHSSENLSDGSDYSDTNEGLSDNNNKRLFKRKTQQSKGASIEEQDGGLVINIGQQGSDTKSGKNNAEDTDDKEESDKDGKEMSVMGDEQKEFDLFNNSLGYTGHDSTQNTQALNILLDIEQNNKSGEDKETDTNDDKSIKEKQK